MHLLGVQLGASEGLANKTDETLDAQLPDDFDQGGIHSGSHACPARDPFPPGRHSRCPNGDKPPDCNIRVYKIFRGDERRSFARKRMVP
jgi:hypothetical protein